MSAPEIERIVDRLAVAPERTGLLLDFDGTLTPIVADPAKSVLASDVAASLGHLAARMAVVAVVSGRPAAFLVERVAVAGVRRLGLYGLEEADDDGVVHARAEAEAWRPTVEQARVRLQEMAADVPGAWVEAKGLSVAVHWRQAADHDAAAAALSEPVAELARATGLALEPGKLVEELRPPIAWDKGSVVDALADEAALAHVAYAGDDLGDLPALRAVRARGGVALAVDYGRETPPEVVAAADFCLKGSEGLAELLAALTERLR